MKYTIGKLDDITVLYNGEGKHDKIYIVVMAYDNNWPSQYHIYGFYRARTARQMRISRIKGNIDINGMGLARNYFDSAVGSKMVKGYAKVREEEHKELNLSPGPVLLKELEELLNSQGQTSNAPTQIKQNEYECVDNFGVEDMFVPGCRYYGVPYARGKLLITNDENRPIEVDEDLFQLVGK